jgi:hypothetical protein
MIGYLSTIAEKNRAVILKKKAIDIKKIINFAQRKKRINNT